MMNGTYNSMSLSLNNSVRNKMNAGSIMGMSLEGEIAGSTGFKQQFM